MVGLYKWFSTSNRRVSVRTSWTASLPQAQRCWVIQMGSIEQMKKTSEKRKKERKKGKERRQMHMECNVKIQSIEEERFEEGRPPLCNLHTITI